jgi:peptide chain release factor 2
MEEPNFWDLAEKSQGYVKELKNLKDTVEEYQALKQEYEDIETLIEMGYEENDNSLIPEIQETLDKFIEDFEELRLSTLLSDEYDKDNAILTLHAGAGGTESCDWAKCYAECIKNGQIKKVIRHKF